MAFLILSKDKTNGIAMWWRPEAKGYTNDIDKAGRFSAEESANYVRGAPDKVLRIPESAIDRLLVTRRIVAIGDANNHTEISAFDGA